MTPEELDKKLKELKDKFDELQILINDVYPSAKPICEKSKFFDSYEYVGFFQTLENGLYKKDNLICTKELVKEIDDAILDEVGGERLNKLKIALCGYLPYGLFVEEKTGGEPVIYDIDYHLCWKACKPYLRPMDSMNGEEKAKYNEFVGSLKIPEDWGFPTIEYVMRIDVEGFIEWLNENRFDWRGLIPLELALEAPEGMYVKKEEENK